MIGDIIDDKHTFILTNTLKSLKAVHNKKIHTPAAKQKVWIEKYGLLTKSLTVLL